VEPRSARAPAIKFNTFTKAAGLEPAF